MTDDPLELVCRVRGQADAHDPIDRKDVVALLELLTAQSVLILALAERCKVQAELLARSAGKNGGEPT